jgi:nicotinamide mononucleotide transporter
MNWHETLSYIAIQWQQISWMEKTAVGFSIAEVLFSYWNKVWLYPAGIISCCLSIFLLAGSKLYAESGLSLYYLVMSIWGWIQWMKRAKNLDHLPISKSNQKDWIIVTAICFGGFAGIFFTLKTFTDSTVPYWDAFVSAVAWAGMYLLAKRKLENWIILNVSNIFAIPLLFHKGLTLYALLTAFLFVVAVLGYFKWKRIMKTEATMMAAAALADQWMENPV